MRFFLMTTALLTLLVVFAVVAEAQTTAPCTHYTSPTGTGDGLSQSSPFKIQNFWSVAEPGKTLCLLDGTYKGTDNMIDPPAGLNGSGTGASTMNGVCPSCITVRALNDGKVLIDGEFGRRPIHLSNNSWFVVEGMNVKNGDWGVVRASGNGNIIRRVVAWDSDIRRNASTIFSIEGVSLAEDVAAFGPGKIMFAGFEDGGVLRRAWARWEGNTVEGGPQEDYDMIYGQRRDVTLENVISANSGESHPQTFEWTTAQGDPTGRMASNYAVFTNAMGLRGRGNNGETNTCHNFNVYGSLVYKLPNSAFRGDNVGSSRVFWSGAIGSCVTWRHVLTVHATTHPEFDTRRGFFFSTGKPGTSKLEAHNITSIRGAAGDVFGSGWTYSSIVSSTSLASINQQGANPWTGTKGANLCKRWKNGVVTSEPLWPWPMNQRIKDATAMAGRYTGPCLKCTWAGGATQAPIRRIADVTADVESLLGPIPSQCRSGGTTPPSIDTSTKLSIGDRIQVGSGPANVRTSGSPSATVLGAQPTGALGTVIGGPVTVDGGIVWWWQIDYDNAPDGWSYEGNLEKAISSLSGDLNADGQVNASDLQLEVNVILGTETNPTIRLRADLNGDGAVNALDLQRLVNLILGL